MKQSKAFASTFSAWSLGWLPDALNQTRASPLSSPRRWREGLFEIETVCSFCKESFFFHFCQVCHRMINIPQVWPLSQFLSVSFLWKLIDLPGEQINDPSSGKNYSLPFPPATPSSPSRTLEGLFELTRRPSRALDSPRELLPKLQRYKDTVRCAALGTEVPGHCQQQLMQTQIAHLLKTHFYALILACEKSIE